VEQVHLDVLALAVVELTKLLLVSVLEVVMA
jgi:hypothetical protein